MGSERFTLVGYVDNLYYIHDSADNEVDALNAAQIKHAVGLGFDIAGVHPMRGARDFSISEENFIQLNAPDDSNNNDTAYEDLQQLQSFVAGIGGNEEVSDEDDFDDFEDFEDFEDSDEDSDEGSEVAIEHTVPNIDSTSSDYEECADDEPEQSEGYSDDVDAEDDFVDDEDDYYEEEPEVEDFVEDDDFDDSWDDVYDDDFDDVSAFQQLTDSLTPEQNHVLAEYYMLRSKLCFDDNITSNANINSAFTAVNNMSNSVRTNIAPSKLAKINAYRQPGKTWVYAGFIDTVARTGEMSYCTFGHALRYKHIVININKIQLGDILYSYTGNDLREGSHGTPSDFINLDVIEQGVYNGDIIEFGATCLADFFDVSVEVMAYVKQVQAQSLEEMGELMRYYVEEQINPGTLQKAMDEFKFFDEVMNLVTMDTVRKITAGKESDLIIPKEYISIYKRFTEVNKNAAKEGKLPLLYPRSLVRVMREYLTGIRAYNSVEFSKKTSKKTHKSYVSVSGLNRVIKILPYLKSGCVYDFLSIVVGGSIAKTNMHPWSYKFISKNSPKSIDNNGFDGEVFLSGADKLVPNSFMSNSYTSRLLTWFEDNHSVSLGPTMSSGGTTVPDYVRSFTLWMLNAFLYDFCGIYGYKRTAPGDETNDRAIYKLDGGNSKSTESYYRALANYRSFSGTTKFGIYLDASKIEYDLGYLEKIFIYDYLEFVVACHLPNGIRRLKVAKDSNGLLSFARNPDGSHVYVLGDKFAYDQLSLNDAFRAVKDNNDEDSEEYKAADYLHRDADDCIRFTVYGSDTYTVDISQLCSRLNLGVKGYKDCTLDILCDGIGQLLDNIRKALISFERGYFNYLENYMSVENDKLLKKLNSDSERIREAVANENMEIDADISSNNLNLKGDTSTLASNNKILADLKSNGTAAFDNYTPQELAMFASYLMTTQYVDAFRNMNAGITAKILETLQSTKFVRVSDKQLYRIKQVLEALIPRFQQDSTV